MNRIVWGLVLAVITTTVGLAVSLLSLEMPLEKSLDFAFQTGFVLLIPTFVSTYLVFRILSGKNEQKPIGMVILKTLAWSPLIALSNIVLGPLSIIFIAFFWLSIVLSIFSTITLALSGSTKTSAN